MKNFELLNNKEIKKLNLQLKEQFNSEFDFSKYLVFLTPKDRVYIVNKEFGNYDFSRIKVNNIGLYFLSIVKDGIRLSIEGSQLFKAEKNILKLDRENFRNWMEGKDLDLEFDKGYVIVEYNGEFLGCGKSNGEKIFNYVPKERRVKFERKTF